MGIKDVARQAGVSTTTVSHALSGKGRLPDGTRERVRRIAEEMGYRPSAVARSLAAGRTGVLGIAFSVHPSYQSSFLTHEWFARIVNAATYRAMREGAALVVVPPTAGPEVWGRLPLDGAIMVEPVVGDPNLAEIAAHGVRMVSVGRPPDVDGWWVDNDNEEAVREALDHLDPTGAGSVTLLSFDWPTAWHDDAAETYRRWCAERGVEPIVVNVGSVEDAGPDVDRLLDDPERRDGVFCVYERLGFELIGGARERGIRVPDELRVVAASDEGVAETAQPPLSTVDFDPDALGAAAASMLIELVEGREPAMRSRLLAARLVVRGSSTGPSGGPGSHRERRPEPVHRPGPPSVDRQDGEGEPRRSVRGNEEPGARQGGRIAS